MSEQDERLNYLRKTLLTMKWDKEHNQLNPGLEAKYNELREEFENLQKESNQELNPAPDNPTPDSSAPEPAPQVMSEESS